MYDYLLVNQHKYGTWPFLTGKLTISMDMFNHYFDIARGYPHAITIVAPWRCHLWPLRPCRPPGLVGLAF